MIFKLKDTFHFYAQIFIELNLFSVFLQHLYFSPAKKPK